MKTFTRSWLFVAILVFTACAPTMTPIPPVAVGNNPYTVQPGDAGMMRGDVRIDSASLALAESQPVQVTVNFAYFQPTPCFKLRVEVSQPDAQKHIKLSAYAVAEKDKPCTLMALATPLQASLAIGSFPKGHYSVWLNGVSVGEFDS